MNVTDAIRTCFAKYAQFHGRARRPEFWWFVAFLFVLNSVAAVVGGLFPGSDLNAFVSVNTLVVAVTLLPALAVGARRLHDVDRSGWWQLLMLVPIIGVIVLIFWWVRPGDTGDNRFGAVPRSRPHAS